MLGCWGCVLAGVNPTYRFPPSYAQYSMIFGNKTEPLSVLLDAAAARAAEDY